MLLTQELSREVAVLRLSEKDCCTYCHRQFGSVVTWHRRRRVLEETADHVLPKALGGRVTVPCCQICNAVKGSLKFDSLAEIQDFCLDRLLKDGSIMLEVAKRIKAEREVAREELTSEEVSQWAASEGPESLPPESAGETLVILEHSSECQGCRQCGKKRQPPLVRRSQGRGQRLMSLRAKLPICKRCGKRCVVCQG